VRNLEILCLVTSAAEFRVVRTADEMVGYLSASLDSAPMFE
jgi:hypothetical protein